MNYIVTDLDALAGPVRRVALEAAVGMPSHLLPLFGVLLARFHEYGQVRAILGDAARLDTTHETTWMSRFARAGYASPKVILDALRMALAVRLLDDGWTAERVANAMEFSSPSAFIRWFRWRTGRTPAARGTLDADRILRVVLSPQLTLAGVA